MYRPGPPAFLGLSIRRLYCFFCSVIHIFTSMRCSCCCHVRSGQPWQILTVILSQACLPYCGLMCSLVRTALVLLSRHSRAGSKKLTLKMFVGIHVSLVRAGHVSSERPAVKRGLNQYHLPILHLTTLLN